MSDHDLALIAWSVLATLLVLVALVGAIGLGVAYDNKVRRAGGKEAYRRQRREQRREWGLVPFFLAGMAGALFGQLLDLL